MPNSRYALMRRAIADGEVIRELPDGRLLTVQSLLFGRGRLMIGRHRIYADDAW